jgi:hypothetical protein
LTTERVAAKFRNAISAKALPDKVFLPLKAVRYGAERENTWIPVGIQNEKGFQRRFLDPVDVR